VPLSNDPERRRRQLQNLRPPTGSEAERRQQAGLLRGSASPGTAGPGNARHMRHGARSRLSQNSVEWPAAVALSIADLEDRVGAELRDEHGDVQAWARPSVEALALARVAAGRVERWLTDREVRGKVERDDFDVHGRAVERYHRGLEREGLTLRSRLEAQAAAFDLARHWQEQPPAGEGDG
jgi:hypothetical protein